MKSFQIYSEESVRCFLKDIYKNYQNPFDPAEVIQNLPGDNGLPFFTKQEGEYLDEVMTQCFIYGVLNDLNIYMLAEEVQSELFTNKAIA